MILWEMLDVTRHRVSLRSDHSPWIISFGSSDPTGTARGDLFKFVLLLLYIFGAHSARGTGFRFDYNLLLYLDYIVFWVYLACWHTL